jgi:hypothetical protein
MSEKPSPPKRSYPAAYEKIVPIALGILGVVVIAMLIFTVLVGVGVLQFN